MNLDCRCSVCSQTLIPWKWTRYSLSHVWLYATPKTAACHAPLSMGFSRQEYWSGLPCPPPGDLPDSGIQPRFPSLQVDSLLSEPPGRPTNSSDCLSVPWNQADINDNNIWAEETRETAPSASLHPDLCPVVSSARKARHRLSVPGKANMSSPICPLVPWAVKDPLLGSYTFCPLLYHTE